MSNPSLTDLNINDIVFVESFTINEYGDNYFFVAKTPLGRLTVLDRMTGFGWRGIESGYMDLDGNFYLIEEDIRLSNKTLGDLIQYFIESSGSKCNDDND